MAISLVLIVELFLALFWGAIIGLGLYFGFMRPAMSDYRVEHASYKTGGKTRGVALAIKYRWGKIKTDKAKRSFVAFSGIKQTLPLPPEELVYINTGLKPWGKPVLHIVEDVNGNAHYANYDFQKVYDISGQEIIHPMLIPKLTNEKEWHILETNSNNQTYTLKSGWDKFLQVMPVLTVLFLLIGGGVFYMLFSQGVTKNLETVTGMATDTSKAQAQIAASLQNMTENLKIINERRGTVVS